jgi:hypothetical protein
MRPIPHVGKEGERERGRKGETGREGGNGINPEILGRGSGPS